MTYFILSGRAPTGLSVDGVRVHKPSTLGRAHPTQPRLEFFMSEDEAKECHQDGDLYFTVTATPEQAPAE